MPLTLPTPGQYNWGELLRAALEDLDARAGGAVAVASVAGKTGVVTLVAADVSGVPTPATVPPAALAAAAALGSGTKFSGEGHVHPYTGLALAVVSGYLQKSADTAHALSSSTMVDDPHLVTPTLAAGTYLFTGMIVYSSGTTADYRGTLAPPGDATGFFNLSGLSAATTGITGVVNRSATVLGTASAMAGVTAETLVVPLVARVVIVTPGPVVYRAAQNTSNASETATTLAGSFLEYRKVA